VKLQVLLFARYAEQVGASRIEVEAGEGATLGSLWEEIRRRHPALAGDAAPLMAIDREYAPAGREVAPGMEIAFFPPVSGG
jgi:molybdopterin converting factor subunit 1